MNNQIRSLLAKCQQEAGLETRDAVQRLEEISIWALSLKDFISFQLRSNFAPSKSGTHSAERRLKISV